MCAIITWILLEVFSMNVRFENVGIIENSEIQIDGITVITGKNNSGKSTSSKAIYSLISSIENLYENATKDIVDYITNELTDSLRNSRLSGLCRRLGVNEDEKDNADIVTKTLVNVYRNSYDICTIEDAKAFISNFIVCISDINDEYIESVHSNSILRFANSVNKDNLEQVKEDLISKAEELLNKLEELSDFSEYEMKKISKSLKIEFDGQLLPVKSSEKLVFEINMQDENNRYCYKIDDGVPQVSGDLIVDDINNVIFLDDVTIVDSIWLGYKRRRDFIPNASLNSFIRAYNHKFTLIEKLSQYDHKNNDIDEEVYSRIKEKLDAVFEDEIIVDDGEYVCSSDNLSISNLATGSKLFAILKILLQNGNLNSKTLLILDEPESHLHPEWQNALSELIAILVKELNVKILIASHSPNFVLGIQTYSIKYGLEKVTNYYSTEKKDGYLVNYKRVNDNLNVIYSDFAKYFSLIKAEYDSLIHGDNE